MWQNNVLFTQILHYAKLPQSNSYHNHIFSTIHFSPSIKLRFNNTSFLLCLMSDYGESNQTITIHTKGILVSLLTKPRRFE